MSRPIILSSLKTGMTRLREKGGASPDALYDLVNGYIDQSGSPVNREGSVVDTILPAGTVGLAVYQDKLYVFALTPIIIADPDYVCEVLIHPDPAFGGSLKQIHFAKPFLGYLYVTAEFSDGSVYDYWLQKPDVWKASTVYPIGATVMPTTPNGYIYTAKTPITAPVWQPNTIYSVGQSVRPTVDNGFIYTITSTAGAAAASGSTEPDWPTQEGALVFEETDTTTVPSTGQTATSSTSTIPPVVIDRYGNSIQVKTV